MVQDTGGRGAGELKMDASLLMLRQREGEKATLSWLTRGNGVMTGCLLGSSLDQHSTCISEVKVEGLLQESPQSNTSPHSEGLGLRVTGPPAPI